MGKTGKSIVVGVMVLAMGVSGVGMMGGARSPAPASGSERTAGAIEALEILPLADEAITESFGAELAAQLALPNPEMDFDAVVAREQFALRLMPEEIAQEQQIAILRGVTDNRRRVPQLVEQLRMRVEGGDSLTHQGTVERDGHSVARFRLVVFGGGIDFYDMLVGLQGDEPVIVDYFSLSSGQWASELMAELYRGVFEAGVDPAETRLFRAFGEAARAEQHEEVLRLYGGLPQHMQRTRVAWARRMEAASLTDNLERYLSILDEYAVLFPRDPSAHARLLDAHFERGQWTEASADIHALDAAFSDPYWNGMRASVAMERGEHASALALAEHVIQADPTLYAGPEVALGASLALGDVVAADRFATTLRGDFGSDLALLATHPGYETLTQLPAFAQPTEVAQP